MNAESLKEAVRRELPNLLREDPEFRAYVLELARQEFTPRSETVDRFDQLLAELKRDREAQTRKWDEQNRRWDEQNRKWEEQRSERERDREEQNRKWEESRKEFDQVHEEIMAQAKKFDRGIGALGAQIGRAHV